MIFLCLASNVNIFHNYNDLWYSVTIEVSEFVIGCPHLKYILQNSLTALHIATVWNRTETVRLLLDHKADIHTVDQVYTIRVLYNFSSPHTILHIDVCNYYLDPWTNWSAVVFTCMHITGCPDSSTLCCRFWKNRNSQVVTGSQRRHQRSWQGIYSNLKLKNYTKIYFYSLYTISTWQTLAS